MSFETLLVHFSIIFPGSWNNITTKILLIQLEEFVMWYYQYLYNLI